MKLDDAVDALGVAFVGLSKMIWYICLIAAALAALNFAQVDDFLESFAVSFFTLALVVALLFIYLGVCYPDFLYSGEKSSDD